MMLRLPVVIVFGPPLPGRSALARALEQRLPGVRRLRAVPGRFPQKAVAETLAMEQIPIVEGDFATAAERAGAVGAIGASGGVPLFVEWMCNEDEARKEIYRRYATLPTRYANRWWELFRRDARIREPIRGELPEDAVIGVAAGGSLLDQVIRVGSSLGYAGTQTRRPPPARRVLVVDDDADTRTLLREALVALGCIVLVAAGSEEALSIAAEEPLDLVITDQQMPGGLGTELAAELSQRRPDVHIALLTGFAEETVEPALETTGVELLLAKPAAGADLIRLLDELTEHAEEA